MRKLVLSLMVCSIIGALQPSAALGQAAERLHYQGQLTDGAGNILPDGPYVFHFAIFDADTLGAMVWGSEQQTLTVTNGLFSAVLGDSSVAITPSVLAGPRWLSIQVDPDAVEMFPRQRILSSAGAITVANNSVGGSQVLNSSLTGADITNSSILDVDIGDEPGLAATRSTGTVNVTSATTSMVDLATVTITIPTSGYIYLIGTSMIDFIGTTSFNKVNVQIDETAGGSSTFPYYTWVGDNAYSGTGDNNTEVTRTRIYFKNAGTYTFRLEAKTGAQAAGARAACQWPQITAVFLPTSYGTVQSIAGLPGAGDLAGPGSIGIDPQARDALLGPETIEVDLRALELRQARLEAELERTRRLAAEARLRELGEDPGDEGNNR